MLQQLCRSILCLRLLLLILLLLLWCAGGALLWWCILLGIVKLRRLFSGCAHDWSFLFVLALQSEVNVNKMVNKNLIREGGGKHNVTVAYQRRRANRCPDKHSRQLAKAMETIGRLLWGTQTGIKGISEKEISIDKPQKNFCRFQYLFDYSVYNLYFFCFAVVSSVHYQTDWALLAARVVCEVAD